MDLIKSGPSARLIPDNILFKWGTDGDMVGVLRSSTLAGNTALTGVLVGTPVTPALAANSLILSNITASGDILLAGNLGGNSRGYLFVDVSADALYLMTAGVARISLGSTGIATFSGNIDAQAAIVNTGAANQGMVRVADVFLVGDDPGAGNMPAPLGMLIVGTSALIRMRRITDPPGMEWFFARGTLASPTALLSGDAIGSMSFRGYGGVEWSGPKIQAVAEGNFGATSHPSSLQLLFVPSGSITATLGARIYEAADGETALLLRRNVAGAFTEQRVSMGATDSGGAGYKLLRVPN